MTVALEATSGSGSVGGVGGDLDTGASYRKPVLVVLVLIGVAIAICLLVLPSELVFGVILGNFLAGMAPFVAVFIMGYAAGSGHQGNHIHSAFGVATTENSVSRVGNILKDVPTEEYVPDDQLDRCSVPRLRKMLEVRGKGKARDSKTNTKQNAHGHKKDLASAVRDCRKASDSSSCCLCLEEYKAGDSLRVLPICAHQFHQSCLDDFFRHWALNVSNTTSTCCELSCPLCKTILK